MLKNVFIVLSLSLRLCPNIFANALSHEEEESLINVLLQLNNFASMNYIPPAQQEEIPSGFL